MSLEKVNEAVAKIRESYNGTPKIGLILGSGLGVLADEVNNPTKLSYSEIPHFPVSTVEDMLANLFLVSWKIKKLLQCKDVSTFMKAIQCKMLLSQFV